MYGYKHTHCHIGTAVQVTTCRGRRWLSTRGRSSSGTCRSTARRLSGKNSNTTLRSLLCWKYWNPCVWCGVPKIEWYSDPSLSCLYTWASLNLKKKSNLEVKVITKVNNYQLKKMFWGKDLFWNYHPFIRRANNVFEHLYTIWDIQH